MISNLTLAQNPRIWNLNLIADLQFVSDEVFLTNVSTKNASFFAPMFVFGNAEVNIFFSFCFLFNFIFVPLFTCISLPVRHFRIVLHATSRIRPNYTFLLR